MFILRCFLAHSGHVNRNKVFFVVVTLDSIRLRSLSPRGQEQPELSATSGLKRQANLFRFWVNSSFKL